MRRKNDAYYTPDDAVMGIFGRLGLSASSLVLEPCSGDGALARPLQDLGACVATNDLYSGHSQYSWDASSPEAWERHCQEAGCRPDWVISNPPFNLAPAIVTNALLFAEKGVVMLLRLSWLEGCKNRRHIHSAVELSQIVVTPRISFTGDGATDNVTTAWFVWHKDQARHQEARKTAFDWLVK